MAMYMCSILSNTPTQHLFFADDTKLLKQIIETSGYELICNYKIDLPKEFKTLEELEKRTLDNSLFAVNISDDYHIREYGLTIARYVYVFAGKKRTTKNKSWYFVLDWDMDTNIGWRAQEHKDLLDIKHKANATRTTKTWEKI